MMMKSKLQRLRYFLHKRADNPRENFIWLVTGFTIFMLGLMAISIAQFAMMDSITAEIIALLGLILMVMGSVLALIGYISLSILRIFRFLDSDDDKTS